MKHLSSTKKTHRHCETKQRKMGCCGRLFSAIPEYVWCLMAARARRLHSWPMPDASLLEVPVADSKQLFWWAFKLRRLCHNCLLVLSREWMGMGVAGMIITSDFGSFPHSLLSTSKTVPQVSATLGVSKIRLENAMAPRKKPQHQSSKSSVPQPSWG